MRWGWPWKSMPKKSWVSRSCQFAPLYILGDESGERVFPRYSHPSDNNTTEIEIIAAEVIDGLELIFLDPVDAGYGFKKKTFFKQDTVTAIRSWSGESWASR